MLWKGFLKMLVLSKEQKEKLMQEIYTDKSFERIARNVGVGVATVKRYAKRLGIRHTFGGRLRND